jgi:hypothetical protein
MNPYAKITLIALCCALPFCAIAQSPQQTNVPDVRHYPNPVGSSSVVNITFSLPTNSYVSLKIFNPLGIQLKELVNGNLVAGDHNIPFDVTVINEGVYFYTLRVNDHSETKKLTIKK